MKLVPYDFNFGKKREFMDDGDSSVVILVMKWVPLDINFGKQLKSVVNRYSPVVDHFANNNKAISQNLPTTSEKAKPILSSLTQISVEIHPEFARTMEHCNSSQVLKSLACFQRF